MLKIQLVATLAVAVGAMFISGFNAGVSASLGGASVMLGALAASAVAKRSEGKEDPTAILVNLLKAEAIKILVIIILLVITFNVYKQLVPFALIAGLAAAAIFSGAALSKLKA
ncbi:MAG: ATP synthase subunit I [Methylotenera sp.]